MDVIRRRPRLLDLFCGQGGAGRGYSLAGFEVVGVDIEPQPLYPYEFHQGDAMTWPLDGYDVVHASPPCQDHSALAAVAGKHGTGWMLPATIARLRAWGGTWVVENVANADMPGALRLCGTEFGLQSGPWHLRRHRLFLSSAFLLGAGGCNCYGRRIKGVYGSRGSDNPNRAKFNATRAAEALGIDWMTHAGMTQAIPPAYTQFIGEQLIAVVDFPGGGVCRTPPPCPSLSPGPAAEISQRPVTIRDDS